MAVAVAAVALVVLAFLTTRQEPSVLRVEATLYRSSSSGVAPLADGGRVTPGDQLYLEIEGSEELHAYVLDEDENGDIFVLFPVDGLTLENPLPAGVRHRLPGELDGVSQDWQVTSAGGRETILVVTSKKPLAPLEREVASLPEAAPQSGPVLAYAELDDSAIDTLRGIAGMAPSQGAAIERRRTARAARRGLRAAGAGVREPVDPEVRAGQPVGSGGAAGRPGMTPVAAASFPRGRRSFAVRVSPPATSRAKYVPPATRAPEPSRPSHVTSWSPAESSSLTRVRTRRPATSCTASAALVPAARVKRNVVSERKGLREARWSAVRVPHAGVVTDVGSWRVSRPA